MYAPTPLRRLDDMAIATGVAAVHYKDEAGRFGLGSFKALGGAYAVARVLKDRLAGQLAGPITTGDLVRGVHRDLTDRIQVVCASDGNHGRSVAAGAQRFGCRCAIYLHQGVSEARADAIRAYGGQVVRVTGTYDDSVRAAAQAARDGGAILVSDTTEDVFDDLPAVVLQGYSVLVIEILEQLHGEIPTHVFLQGGVGGLAAAVVAHLWETLGVHAPLFVVVEPGRADCLFQSALAGGATPATGDLDTVMAGLSCGEVSALAWSVLKDGAQAFMTIEDADAVAAMRLLADRGDSIVAGESAVAGLAGFLKVAASRQAAQDLGLDSLSRILLIGTEGATDPGLYTALVGRTAEQVSAGQGRGP